MRNLIVLAGIVCTLPAGAADVGVGLSLESNDSTIYVPIDVSESLRIEPLLRYMDLEQQVPDARVKNEIWELGVGVFGLKSLGESIRIYYGGRLAYLESENRLTAGGQIDELSADGYRIAPTFGFEYIFNERFSIGGEAAWFYSDTDASNDLDSSSTGTDTRVILRFKF